MPQAPNKPYAQTTRSPLHLLLSGLCALGLALALRHCWVESEEMGAWCRQTNDWRCVLRQGVIESFLHGRLGFLSGAAALLALGLRSRRLAWIGWMGGIMGLTLYCFEASAFAALLALLLLARPPHPNNPLEAKSRQSIPQA
ncbi:MAG: hypothetical protein LBF51_05580 [Zoogloeaceae bacterium]|jgi:predicted cobalt transporter CbtA|nr:hypothetical protein [Zoogloeaceae bacterium]